VAEKSNWSAQRSSGEDVGERRISAPAIMPKDMGRCDVPIKRALTLYSLFFISNKSSKRNISAQVTNN
jgi:hypothetical protein